MNLEQAEQFVQSNRYASWNNYTIELFVPAHRAMWNKNGVYRYGKWGYLNSFDPNNEGIWHV